MYVVFLRLAIQLCAWHCVHFSNWTTLSRRWLLWLRAFTGITFLLFVNRRCDDTEEIERNSRKHNIDSNNATETKLRTEFSIEGASNRFVCSRNMAMYNVQCTDYRHRRTPSVKYRNRYRVSIPSSEHEKSQFKFTEWICTIPWSPYQSIIATTAKVKCDRAGRVSARQFNKSYFAWHNSKAKAIVHDNLCDSQRNVFKRVDSRRRRAFFKRRWQR